MIQYIYKNTAAIGRPTATALLSTATARDVGKAGLDLAQATGWRSRWHGDGGQVIAQRVKESGFDPESPVMWHLFHLVGTVLGFPATCRNTPAASDLTRALVGAGAGRERIDARAHGDRVDKDDPDALGSRSMCWRWAC